MTANEILKEMGVSNNTFEGVVEKMIEMHKAKDHDYGNAYEESLDEEGMAAARVLIGNKYKRLKALTTGNVAQVKDESIDDTLLDMANYCIMTYVWRNK